MKKIAESVEGEIHYWQRFMRIDDASLVSIKQNMIVGHSLCELAMQTEAKAIFSLSSGGHTPRAISSFRPNCPIYVITPNESTAKTLNLVWGVTPILVDASTSGTEMIKAGLKIAKDAGYIYNGDTVIISESDTYSEPSNFGVSTGKRVGGIYTV